MQASSIWKLDNRVSEKATTISILKAEKLAIIAQRDSITEDWLRAKESMYNHYEKCAFMDKDSFFIDSNGYIRMKNPRNRDN